MVEKSIFKNYFSIIYLINNIKEIVLNEKYHFPTRLVYGIKTLVEIINDRENINQLSVYYKPLINIDLGEIICVQKRCCRTRGLLENII